jgi:hypothetical protein
MYEEIENPTKKNDLSKKKFTEKLAESLVKHSSSFATVALLDARHELLLNNGQTAIKKFLTKIPVKPKDLAEPNRTKFKSLWIAKLQQNDETINEVIIAEAFRIMLGSDYAPKYRSIIDDETKKIWSISKILEDFESAQEMIGINGKEIIDDKKLIPEYIRITENLEGFEKMLAVNLLFGKNDIHLGNWGKAKKHAATVDHGQADGKPFNISVVMNESMHLKERIATHKFIIACREVASEFVQKQTQIKDSLYKAKEAAAIVFEPKALPDIEELIKKLNGNSNQLITLAAQIEAELAIISGDPIKLRQALENIDATYLPLQTNEKITQEGNFPIISQRTSSGFTGYGNFIELIATRLCDDYSKISEFKVIKSTLGKDPQATRFQFNANFTKRIPDNIREKLLDPKNQQIEKELMDVYEEVAKTKQQSEGKYAASLIGSRERSLSIC